MKKEEYYLGFDIGTNSVGWAVTDADYKVLKFNGKSMWGTRLFNAANTAEERRGFRANRRRKDRKKWRLKLLQEIFAEEICKVDAGFYQRMKDSFFYPEDKQIEQTFSLFNDVNYTDAEYHQEFPTIYHLRKALIQGDKQYDIRLVYLALHHILKHRGHFLFQGVDAQKATSFQIAYEELRNCLSGEFGVELLVDSRL